MKKIINFHFVSSSEFKILTLPTPCISQSCIEIKIKLNFYFLTSLWYLKGLHKTF